VTATVRDAAPVLDSVEASGVTYSPRLTPATWPQTEQSREITFNRLIAPPFRSPSAGGTPLCPAGPDRTAGLAGHLAERYLYYSRGFTVSRGPRWMSSRRFRLRGYEE